MVPDADDQHVVVVVVVAAALIQRLPAIIHGLVDYDGWSASAGGPPETARPTLIPIGLEPHGVGLYNLAADPGASTSTSSTATRAWWRC